MNHVFVVETVVPEVVVDDFERGKVFVVGVKLYDSVHGVDQNGFAPCVFYQSVPGVPNGTHTPNDSLVFQAAFG